MKPPASEAQPTVEPFDYAEIGKRTLPGGVRIADLALPTTDEEPFPLVRLKCGRILVALLALACSAPDGRFLVLESEEVHGFERLCVYQDAVGARAITVGAGEICPPTLELDE